MKTSLRDLAEKLNCRLLGNGSIAVTTVSSLQSAGAESLLFVDDAKHLEAALASQAAAVIAGDFASTTQSHKPLLISKQPRLTFARAAKLLRDTGKPSRSIHPSAIVEAAVIGGNVEIGPRAVIAENVRIGESSTCLLYTSPSPRDGLLSRMPSSA